MEIKPLEKKDIPKLQKLIKEEFPYISFSRKELNSKLRDEKIFIFKAMEKGNLQGYVELQLCGKGEARLIAVAVLKASRGKGISKKLMEFALEFLKEKKVEEVSLLVAEDNKWAKEIYKKFGFGFEGLYYKKIGGKVIEEWELLLAKKIRSYIN